MPNDKSQSQEDKKIIISCFHPLISRNILGTGLLDLLLARGLGIVIATFDYKVGYYRERFGRDGVEVVGVAEAYSARSRVVHFWKRIVQALPNTKRAAVGRRMTLEGKKKHFVARWLFYEPIGLLGRFIFFHKLCRFLDFYTSPRGRFCDIIEKYKPDFIFSTDIQNEHDVALMQDARRKAVKVIGMVRSWDNLTMRGLRIIPERIFVHNEIIKREAKLYHGADPQIVEVIGIPHYDRYIAYKPGDKSTYLSSLMLDPRKKLIVYAPMCDFRMENNDVDRYVLEILAGLEHSVIVRFPPAATAAIGDFKPPHNMIFDRPGYDHGRGVGDRDLTEEDDVRYMEMLAHADAVVLGPSTVIIDAALFDKPMILVDFYPRSIKPEEMIYEYYVEHIENILATKGVARARSKGEFLEALERYLADPQLDHDGRACIVNEQCQYSDSRSNKRLVKHLLKNYF